jgi:predicted ATPase
MIDTDLGQFQELLEADPQTAVDLYQGDFLAGLALPDAQPFNEWRTMQQEHLHQQMMQALSQLLDQKMANSTWAEVISLATRQLELVAWHEPAHRALIRALAAQGNHAQAMIQYDACRAILRDELGLEPAAETRALLAQISADLPPITNLPHLAAPLIGRSAEIQATIEQLAEQRQVTLLGQGGIGKSRLALAVGQRLLNDFEEGVWLVGLAGVEGGEPDRIYAAIGVALGIEFHSDGSPQAQLCAALRPQNLLLILDNFEHLVATADCLLPLLTAAPQLRLLITSRVRLNLPEERLLPLTGLPLAAATQLFLRQAQSVVDDFVLNHDNQTAVARICELVEGLPLGIELAAIWVEHFSCAEIAEAIAANRAFLARQAGANDQRHGSLRAVFEHSWQLLSAQERRVLAQLSIFRGEFGREAALTITDTGLSELSALLSRSLLRRAYAGRYDLHEVVREFAAEKREQDPEQSRAAAIQAAFRHYYLQQVTQKFSDVAALSPDLDNIRAAWQNAVAADDNHLLYTAVAGLRHLMHGLGLIREGLALLERAREKATGDLAAAILLQQSNFVTRLFGTERGLELLQQALTLTDDPRLRITIHSGLARGFSEFGHWPAAEKHHLLQEEIARTLNDKLALARTLTDHATDQALHFVGDFRPAIERLEMALALIGDRTTDEDAIATDNIYQAIIKGLQIAHLRYGNYGQALHYGQQRLILSREKKRRNNEIDDLLVCGLVNFFMGRYQEAKELTTAGLALAEEVEDREGVGLLQANLCLINRNLGDLDQALSHGETAIALLQKLGAKRMEGQARNRLGHTLLAQRRWQEAEHAYRDALATWQSLANPNMYEAKAGQAVALLSLGQPDEARQLVDEVLEFTMGDALKRVVEPILLLLNCETVLAATGQSARAVATLQQAQTWMETIASRNDDVSVRGHYWHNIPAHIELRQRLSNYGMQAESGLGAGSDGYSSQLPRGN